VESRIVNSLLDERDQYVNLHSSNIVTMWVVRGLYECILLRDSFTARHSLRVALYSYLLAKSLDASRTFEYFLGGLIHDVGKISFPDYIIKGAAKFGEEERSKIQKHVQDSVLVLQQLKMPLVVLRMARYHHERFNGTGYLEGLSGADIPLEGRITAIADVYSAITDKGRAYQKRRTHDEAVSILHKECEQFDPDILQVFLKLVEVFPDLYIESIESLIILTKEEYKDQFIQSEFIS
jgi:putative nucleotidyltransferase with HDIG domain